MTRARRRAGASSRATGLCGRAICRTCGRASATAFACTGRGTRLRASAATRRSCCSTPMPARSRARCAGTRRSTVMRPMTRIERTAATRRRTSRARCWWPRTSTGAMTAAPGRAMADSIFYEVHVKGFTKLHPDVPEELRGTYAGLAHPAAVAHLQRLGVTAVELLPVHQFVHDAQLVAARAAQLLGLSVDRLLRAAQRLLVSGRRRWPGRRVSPDGPRAARRRAGGDPRRRVQPHRRGQRIGADAVLSRDRQRGLLPPAGRPLPLRRRHRLRQHRGPVSPAAAAPGDGRAALLGAGDARGRLSLRPRGQPRRAGRATSTRTPRSWRRSARIPCSRR